MSGRREGGMKYFAEDSAGFRIQPKTVLIMSLVYIGIVILLHIYSKLGAAPVTEAEMPKGPSEEPTVEPETEQAYTDESL
jgi:preprotein translocase subunit Sec61beta